MNEPRRAQKQPKEVVPSGKRILLADDDDAVAELFARILRSAGYDVIRAVDGNSAQQIIQETTVDAIVTDISMPSMNGIDLLKSVRSRDKDLPVILVTGKPETASAIEAVHYGALRYFVKPVDPEELRETVADAIEASEDARVKAVALPILNEKQREIAERAQLEAFFESALERLYMVYQPIVCPSAGRILGYEALVRTEEEFFDNPGELLETAEKLNAVVALGRKVRDTVARDSSRLDPDALVFVNLHPFELEDEELFSPSAPLSRLASRVVYEITERVALDHVESIEARLQSLRDLGFRIAVDDLGSGYAGLTSFVTLGPEFTKVDMDLIRDIDKTATKQELVRSLVEVCAKVGIELICEGVETVDEANALAKLGARIFQGYLFSAPQKISHWDASTKPTFLSTGAAIRGPDQLGAHINAR